jgi:anti-anti-sigma regulatory factor
MLRITITNVSGLTRLKLEGKLAHEWVREAETAWGVLTSLNGKQTVLVDLVNVTFVDEAGALLLAHMRHGGAKLVGSGLLIAALIEEIEQAELASEENMARYSTKQIDYEGEVEQ